MDRSEVQELIRQLKSNDESLRLRAVNLLAQEPTDSVRLALPSLKDAFLNDPNPAVKYLARKALKNHGVDPDALQRGAPLPGEAADVDSGATGVLALQGGVRAFFRTAQEYLRAPVNTLCRVMQINDDLVGPWLLERAEHLAVDLLLPHLVELHAGDDANVPPGRVLRLLEVARAWHSQPREATFPEREDIRGRGLADVLAVLATSPSPLARAMSARLGEHAAMEPLIQLLSDDSPLVQQAAAGALASLGARRRELQLKILNAAIALFKPGEPESRLIAVARLARELANSTAVPFVKSNLPTSQGAVRAALVDVVAKLKIPDAEKADLCGAYLRDASPLVVTRAMACLWTSSQKPFITYTLSRFINHREVEVRRELAEALKDTGQEDVLPYLFQLVKDPDDSVRVQAVAGLDRVAGANALDRLVELAGDASPAIRAVALRELVEVGLAEELAVLRQGTIVTEAPAVVVVNCPSGLRPGSRPLATEIPLDTPFIREHALAALEGLADPKFGPLVEGLVLDRFPRVKARAARLLWKFGELWAADSVNDLLASGEPREWEAGVEALAELIDVTRIEGRLMHYPLLRTALRKQPLFETHAKKKP